MTEFSLFLTTAALFLWRFIQHRFTVINRKIMINDANRVPLFSWFTSSHQYSFQQAFPRVRGADNSVARTRSGSAFPLCFIGISCKPRSRWCYRTLKQRERGFLAPGFKPTPAIKYLLLQSGMGGKLRWESFMWIPCWFCSGDGSEIMLICLLLPAWSTEFFSECKTIFLQTASRSSRS